MRDPFRRASRWLLFPGRPDSAHQKDEYIEIDDLLRSTALYAEAIYELAK